MHVMAVNIKNKKLIFNSQLSDSHVRVYSFDLLDPNLRYWAT